MIPSLNGLRALSILLVLAAHCLISSGHKSWLIHTYAHVGVLTFFVLSGFLITTLMLKETSRLGTVNIGQFYARRAWRILPVAYTYLTIITLIRHSEFTYRDITLSWTYLASYAVCIGNFPWDIFHLWSLSVEEQFYFIWPLVFVFNLRLAKWLSVAAILTAPISRYLFTRHGLHEAALYSFPAVVDSIATGCLIALYRPQLALRAHYFGYLWIIAFTSPTLMLIADHTQFLWPLPQLLGHCAWTIFNISAGLGILWAIAAQPKTLNHWLPVWLGTISYSLYIWHMPFMNPQAHIPFPLNLILAFTAAAVSYYLLEQPILKLRATTPQITYTRIATKLHRA